MADATSNPAFMVPQYDHLIWPTLVALKSLGGSGSNQEIDAKVAELEGFTDEQLTLMHGKGRISEIAYRSMWSRTYLRVDGAIEQSKRGVWAITDRGRSLDESDIKGLVARVKALYKGKTETAPETPGPPNQDAELPVIGEPVPVKSWKDVLLEALMKMTPAAFERLAQRLLREEGFTEVRVTGRSGDGGIDGVGVLQMSLLSFPVVFQCKRWAGAVGAPQVRDLRGAMAGRADKALLITTGGFTPEAKREATRDGAPPIDLVDGERLCDLLRDRSLGVSVQLVEQVNINPDWFEGV